MKRKHHMPFGADALGDGGVRFALWAPSIARVTLELGEGGAQRALPMDNKAEGWHELIVADARAGDDYRFRLPDGLAVPDPASRYNPGDVHGPSRVMDAHSYHWHDDGWLGLPWEHAVIYELHVGTFTPEGTFVAATARLAELQKLGISVVELMPLADFPGQRNWGYDGVLQFAPDASYGTPDELKQLVDTAHGLGMAVLIDVVYNHFGPEGNYLHAYCPEFFNALHQTPWGPVINFHPEEARTVRDFFVHNALYWVDEFHFDGLRMDAIHAIRDESQPDIVREVCTAIQAGPNTERSIHVVLENELNEASFLTRDEHHFPDAGSAQWNDDLHHAAHVLTTGESEGYYGDYADAPVDHFGKALAEGFVYQGQGSPFRGGEERGEPSTHLPLAAFVSFLQTHDQVGNRAFGERIGALADPVLLRAAYACLLLSPHTPMLFMGEEYVASTPFLYFCDFGPDLAKAVSEGRRGEFGAFAAFADEAARARIPDPNDPATFEKSKLKWDERRQAPHRDWLALIERLLALRRQWIAPHLPHQEGAGRWWREGEGQDQALRVEWTLGGPEPVTAPPTLHLLAHFGNGPARVVPPRGDLVYSDGVDTDPAQGLLRLERGAVLVTLAR